MPRGGARPNSGRKPGQPTKRTQTLRSLADTAAAAGITPLEYMLGVMRDADADEKRRDAMAIAAAPYVHPKLASVDMTADVDATVAVTSIELVAASFDREDHATH